MKKQLFHKGHSIDDYKKIKERHGLTLFQNDLKKAHDKYMMDVYDIQYREDDDNKHIIMPKPKHYPIRGKTDASFGKMIGSNTAAEQTRAQIERLNRASSVIGARIRTRNQRRTAIAANITRNAITNVLANIRGRHAI